MKQGFGIAGLIIAFLAIFAPYGVNIAAVVIAMLLVCIAALAGDRAWAIATSLLSAANLFLFSPLTLAALGVGGGSWVIIIALCILALPIVAIALNASGKMAISKQS